MKRIINNFKPETKSLIKSLIAAGFTLISGNNGENGFKFTGKLPEFIENATACDECQLTIGLPTSPVDPISGKPKTCWLYLVFGNEPGVLVADYSNCESLDPVIEGHYEKWCNRTQPTLEVETKY